MGGCSVDALIDALEGWRDLIDAARRPNNRQPLVWRSCITFARALKPLSWLTAALITGGALAEDTFIRKSRGFRMVVAFFTIVYGLDFWAVRRARCMELLQEVEQVARKLQPFSGNQQGALERARLHSARSIRVGQVYSIADVATIMVPLILSQDETDIPLWPWPGDRGGVIAGGVVLTFLGAPFAFPSFIVVSFYYSCLTFEIALYGILGEALQLADTPQKIKEVAQLDVRLTSFGLSLRDTLATVLTVFLSALLLIPLMSTVLFFLGQIDLFTLASIPYVMAFVLMCYLGQDTEDTFESFAAAAYSGQWPKVTDSSTRATIQLMMSRRRRRLGIATAKAITNLNLTVCRETMNHWYQLLQVLLKLF